MNGSMQTRHGVHILADRLTIPASQQCKRIPSIHAECAGNDQERIHGGKADTTKEKCPQVFQHLHPLDETSRHGHFRHDPILHRTAINHSNGTPKGNHVGFGCRSDGQTI